jgi:hypothetical protein
MAAQLRRETNLTLKWIAAFPAIGNFTNVSNLLGARQRKQGKAPFLV